MIQVQLWIEVPVAAMANPVHMAIYQRAAELEAQKHGYQIGEREVAPAGETGVALIYWPLKEAG